MFVKSKQPDFIIPAETLVTVEWSNAAHQTGMILANKRSDVDDALLYFVILDDGMCYFVFHKAVRALW